MIGQTISHYRILSRLGAGGMGEVYLAEDPKHHRQVAIKVLTPEIAATVGSDRFLREIAITAKLTHPHVLPVYDSGSVEGRLYYVMPYVEGESLRQRLQREKQLPLDDALRIAREVADALSYAHSRGVVHRDIKPENILLESGHAVVADFGIARAIAAAGGEALTQTGVVVGTPAYMSPEQAAGSGDLDGRSDLYSLGCVLYEMLAGVPPFSGSTAESLAHQHLCVTPRPVTELRPAVPGGVAAALQRALAKTPADRFNPVALFGEALGQRETMPAPPRGRTDIAVLPFQNLSAGSPYDYFAGGLHDEVLTQLAKVAALKVISRTSVMGYASTTKSLKQIAAELGVGSIVEGSVQVAGNRLRVNVQLIDAATDGHLWAERYDRTLDDAFAIQSDVAQQIVWAMGTVLASGEREAIAAAPTANAEAYRLYLQGEEYRRRPGNIRGTCESAQQLFERALGLDPSFALAHAALSLVHGRMHWFRYDPSPARAASQHEEAEAALRLAPDLPEAHMAMGVARYFRRDYRRALDEYAIAMKGLPNDAELWLWIGAVNRRLGNWDKVFTAFEKAAQLDPRNTNVFWDLGGHSFCLTRRYADAVRAYDQALSLAPDLHVGAVERGWAFVRWQGRIDILRATLDRIPSGAELGEFGGVAAQRAVLLLWERDAGGLLRELENARGDFFDGQEFFLPRTLCAAWAHELRGDREAAHAAFASAHERVDSAMREIPDDWRLHVARGLILAGLGQRDEALREAHWLQRSEVYREDAMGGAQVAEDRARILAQAGDAEAALDEIERLLAGPSWLTVHTLRLDPSWDRIREHPRFKALLVKYANPEWQAG